MLDDTSILLVDRDRPNLLGMAAWLKSEGFVTTLAQDGPSALNQFFNAHPDIVVIDLDLGNTSGWEVVERIREISHVPIIAIAQDTSPSATARALRLGLDGFLIRPIDRSELLMRVRSVTEQASDRGDSRWVYRSNGFTIDRRSCEVKLHGQPVDLTSLEYRLLAYLVDRRGWVLTRDQILASVWGADYAEDRGLVKLYMWNLRRKLGDDAKEPKLIRTKRGLGYSFVG